MGGWMDGWIDGGMKNEMIGDMLGEEEMNKSNPCTTAQKQKTCRCPATQLQTSPKGTTATSTKAEEPAYNLTFRCTLVKESAARLLRKGVTNHQRDKQAPKRAVERVGIKNLF